MSVNQNQSYRADIDGLRALAIMSVLLYHARLGCPGDYVGVDVFFVISGYLITSLILKEQAEGVFRLAVFWERRIRRIFPALALMLAGTFLLGWFMFLPEDFRLMARSAIAQAVLLSNVVFYQEMFQWNGYFGPTGDTKPLLNTWSLSVEEQFYLFYPLLMILAVKRRIFLRVVIVLGLLSLLMSLWYFLPQYYDPLSTIPHPNVFLWLVFGYWHQVALTSAPAMGGFFLLPPRAWELLLGALLVLMRGKMVFDQGARELLGLLGVGMVGYAIFRYNGETPFPGIAALLPCLGAALIIFSNEGKLSLVGRLLSIKPVVFIGLISYSLYLWHWPLLIFDKYPSVRPGPWERVAVLAVSFVLATLSWKFVETPFRKRQFFPKRGYLFAFAGCITIVFLTLGVWVYSSKGMPSRLNPAVNRYADFRNHYAFRIGFNADQIRQGQVVELGFTNSTPFDLIVWGDSHSMAVAPVISDLCRKYSWHGALMANTAPVVDDEYGQGDKHYEFPRAVLDQILQRHIKIVIMAARWSLYPPTPQFKENLISTVQTELGFGARVYVLRDVPHPGFDVPRLVAINAMRGEDFSRLGTSISEYSDLNKPMDTTFNELSKIGATVLDPTPYFINSRGIYGVVKDGQVLYWDNDHLTVEGAAFLAPMFEPIFQTNTVLLSETKKANPSSASK